MAKDDYFSLVYKLLSYLYACLKINRKPNWATIAPNTKDFPIGEEYFAYILSHLLADGYIEGITEVRKIGSPVQFKETKGISITPKGIQYPDENSMMKKAAQLVEPITDIASMVIQAVK